MTPPKELRREIANLPEVNRANLDPDITRFICHHDQYPLIEACCV